MAGVGKRTYLREVNPYLICPLCRGYLIDATTVVECLHSFCRSCILKHLSTEAHCPSCKHVLNKAKPNIKADKALQDIVYKLVPGLYHKEMRKRREFYKKHPEHADFATPEQRGEDVSGRLIFAPEDAVSLSLEYLPPGADPLTILLSTNDDVSHSNTSNGHNNNNNNNNNHGGNMMSNRRYLQCPALVTIAHLKKFLALKYSVDMTRYTIEICHRRAPLPEHWTLMDVAYIYAWKRNAPMRFFYRVALEEQRLEAPPHERPSTPGLGASLPPADAIMDTKDTANVENLGSDADSIPEVERTVNRDEVSVLEKLSVISNEKLCSPIDKKDSVESKEVETIIEQPSSNALVSMVTTSTTVAVSVTNTSTTTTASNTVTTNETNNETNKQIKTPIKILKNSDGRYEVLRSPAAAWKEQNSTGTETKASNPEFSVVSIGNGQNSNGVKITLKQCTPANTSPTKPKVISNVLLHCGQVEKDSPGALVIQQIQRDREKQEKQKRRVTFVERSTPEKSSSNIPKAVLKKSGEQQEKKQFLQGFQLTARETESDNTVSDSISKKNEINASSDRNDVENKGNVTTKKEQENSTTETLSNTSDVKKKNTSDDAGLIVSGNVTLANKRVLPISGVNNARMNAKKQCSDVEARGFGYTKSSNATVNISANNNPAKIDVYTFSNDPPVVPAGAVKRKCPPGLPIFEIKRKRQHHVQAQATKKQTSQQNICQSSAKSPRKPSTEPVLPVKRPAANVVTEAGPSRAPTPISAKPSPGPVLSNDTRNILDGCGLNIPASLSITLTAPKSPNTSSGFVEPSDPKDNRKGTLGKVSPSITLNDRSVDPRVLKALKAGQIRMPAPPKPRQTKQPDRELNHQRPVPPAKRKRDQESRDILDLSGGKKIDIHPLRIPQPVPKLKSKPSVRDNIPSLPDQGQVVTLMGGHRYYRAPPGSLTPAAHRVNDCPLPTPSRTPVYAPGLSSPLNNSRSNTNLSSVFPSLQSLYALSQAPNLQQFQMDTRLRLSRGTDSNSSTIGASDNRNTPVGIHGKSHLAAQCAPIKPARSSVAPLAVPIAKQQSSERSTTTCLNRPLSSEKIKNPPVFRSNDALDSTDTGQPLSVQTKYSPGVETNNRYSPRSTTNSGANNIIEDKTPTDTTRETNSESTNNSRKEPDNSSRQQQQHHHEAASPRVSSTASPSPPPGDTTASTNSDENTPNRSDTVNHASSGIDSDVPASSPIKNNVGSEVSSSKSPASPDSSSVTIESPSSKSCSIVEQGLVSPTQTSEVVKSSDLSTKPDNSITDDLPNDSEKNKVSFKQSDAKHLTSEMFQKRLLAAFPSNEWANNPIAAEHLGNFLKSLNASIKTENKHENINADKVESQTVGNDTTRISNEASSKSQTDVAE